MAYYSTGAPAYAMPWWMRQEDPTPQSEMPTGQLVRSTNTMGTDALQRELMALQAPAGRYGGRVPAFLGGAAAGLGGMPGLGFLLGGMAQQGMQNRITDLGRANTQRQIAQQYPSSGGISSPVNPFVQVAQAVSGRSDADRGYSSADRSGRNETVSQRGGLGGV